jgi:hypothetical protein
MSPRKKHLKKLSIFVFRQFKNAFAIVDKTNDIKLFTAVIYKCL